MSVVGGEGRQKNHRPQLNNSPTQQLNDTSMLGLFCLPLSLLQNDTVDGGFDDSVGVHTYRLAIGRGPLLSAWTVTQSFKPSVKSRMLFLK